MNTGLTINIGWEWFLGIVGVLLVLGWKASGRISVVEEAFSWIKDDIRYLKDSIRELKIISDNRSNPAFENRSPVNLTVTGLTWLSESGLKEFVDKNKVSLLQSCESKKNTNPYEVQKHIFNMFDTIVFDSAIDDKLKRFAFGKGTSMETVRRVGAIYLRNLCLTEFGMDKEDIDKHDPDAKPKEKPA